MEFTIHKRGKIEVKGLNFTKRGTMLSA